MESLASGVPVVAHDIRGNREVVRSGLTGFLVPVMDRSAFVSALVHLSGDPKKRHAMGVRGREDAELRFDERKVFERLFRCLERLYAKGRKPEILKSEQAA
jgi:glycosyltransferase involved in cell wall biosynthesis